MWVGNTPKSQPLSRMCFPVTPTAWPHLGPVTRWSAWAPADQIRETGCTGEGPPVGNGSKWSLLRPTVCVAEPLTTVRDTL